MEYGDECCRFFVFLVRSLVLTDRQTAETCPMSRKREPLWHRILTATWSALAMLRTSAVLATESAITHGMVLDCPSSSMHQALQPVNISS